YGALRVRRGARDAERGRRDGARGVPGPDRRGAARRGRLRLRPGGRARAPRPDGGRASGGGEAPRVASPARPARARAPATRPAGPGRARRYPLPAMNLLDPIDWASLPLRPWKRLCRVPEDLESVTARGREARPRDAGLTRGAVERIWDAVEALYRTGLHPAIQICVRRHGAVVLDRAIGHAAGNAPGADPDAPKTRVTPETPFRIYSASKAVTAMVIHKLDDLGKLHIDDRVADYVPAFRR